MSKHVFLTGPPGVGKTTLIQKVTQALKSSGVPIDGFYTQEVREGGRRTGFDVVTLSGNRGPLSRVSPSSGSSASRREYRVGQYVVDLVSFEQLVLPMLRNVNQDGDTEKRICVIDEIGKMELFSQAFIQAVRQTLAGSGTVVLGTIPIPKGKPLDLVEEIRSRKDVRVFNCTAHGSITFAPLCSSWMTVTPPKTQQGLDSIQRKFPTTCTVISENET
ncbi:cancer-related nucleoside-triphosphatase isoform X1 [Poecile atricapillus]|uniref:cancer-related nucleoside-triphosphatase isoform X1 n=1 Tax=Poecile atricapillus TaxID=48891 RepID=UPI002738E661|nr:cancer-related nucleoside-triphosphatase isoform X1 [Poecile atricapillus]